MQITPHVLISRKIQLQCEKPKINFNLKNFREIKIQENLLAKVDFTKFFS